MSKRVAFSRAAVSLQILNPACISYHSIFRITIILPYQEKNKSNSNKKNKQHLHL